MSPEKRFLARTAISCHGCETLTCIVSKDNPFQRFVIGIDGEIYKPAEEEYPVLNCLIFRNLETEASFLTQIGWIYLRNCLEEIKNDT